MFTCGEEAQDIRDTLRTSLLDLGYSDIEVATVYAGTPTPIALNGYYPLYGSQADANAVGNGSSHTHVVNGVTYYMPDAGVTIYHGNYTG